MPKQTFTLFFRPYELQRNATNLLCATRFLVAENTWDIRREDAAIIGHFAKVPSSNCFGKLNIKVDTFSSVIHSPTAGNLPNLN